MILVDTSVWVDHLRKGNSELTALLERGAVLMHPFVLGELACGNLGSRRTQILHLLADLPRVTVATDQEVIGFIERHSLMGRGIGHVDAHLLAATALQGGSRLWTRDKRLMAIAEDMGLGSRQPR
jgi:predicted nucleic acid-binding protein